MKVTKKKVIKAINQLHHLTGIWYNGGTPTASFRPAVLEAKEILEELLCHGDDVDKVLKVSWKKDKK